MNGPIRVIERIQELTLESKANILMNRNGLRERQVSIEEVRSIQPRVGSESTGRSVRVKEGRVATACRAGKILRINAIRVGVARNMEYTDRAL